MQRFLILLALACVSACNSAADGSVAEVKVLKVDWKKLPDGSFGWLDSDDGMSVTERCWKVGKAYSCIMMAEPSGPADQMATNTQILAYGHSRAQLTANWVVPSSGYRCSYSTISPHSEHIDLPSGASLQNALDRGPWSRNFVNKFVEENAPGTPVTYFDCAALVSFLSQGNRDAFLTTAISAKELGIDR